MAPDKDYLDMHVGTGWYAAKACHPHAAKARANNGVNTRMGCREHLLGVCVRELLTDVGLFSCEDST